MVLCCFLGDGWSYWPFEDCLGYFWRFRKANQSSWMIDLFLDLLKFGSIFCDHLKIKERSKGQDRFFSGEAKWDIKQNI